MSIIHNGKIFYTEEESRTMAHAKIRKDAAQIASRYSTPQSESAIA